MKRPVETIFQIINSLTTDEDYRQDLWVFYLENNSAIAFAYFLERIKLGQKRYVKDKKFVQDVFKDSSKLQKFLLNFTDFEKEIMFLMAMGYTASKIARYKGISEVRILQALDVIKGRHAWIHLRKEVHGS